MQTQKQHSTLTQTTQGLRLRCRYCAAGAVTLSVTHKANPTKNWRAIVAKVACEHCHHAVIVAKVNGGAIVAQCPKCGCGATLAVGKSNGGAPYRFKFTCDNPRCDWEASGAFMLAFSDLRPFLDQDADDA
jgi:DNA-directed RNA polymerase subunit RPC12/RpoP